MQYIILMNEVDLRIVFDFKQQKLLKPRFKYVKAFNF